MSKYANDLDMMSQALLAQMQRERDDAIKASMQMQRERDDANKALALAYMSGSYDAKKQLAACQADAARYRYLRHASRRECLDKNGPEAGCWIDCEDENHMLILLTEEDADNAIDAAMAKVE